MITKFGAWHKKEKRIYEVEIINFKTGLCKCFGNENWNAFEDWYPYATVELIQSTGLKDKNGKEIFEGDIVILFGRKNYPYKVGWSKFDVGWRLSNMSNVGIPPEDDIEVIGNIHENPELLKESNR